MKILFLGIGKTKHSYLTEGIERYKKLLSKDALIREKYLKESGNRPGAVDEESAVLEKAVPSGYRKILLDIDGKRMSSEKFSSLLKKMRDTSVKGVAFMIGGSDGVNSTLKNNADERISFSNMTMTHQMIRLFLAEQIYRAYSIMNNRKYHK